MSIVAAPLMQTVQHALKAYSFISFHAATWRHYLRHSVFSVVQTAALKRTKPEVELGGRLRNRKWNCSLPTVGSQIAEQDRKCCDSHYIRWNLLGGVLCVRQIVSACIVYSLAVEYCQLRAIDDAVDAVAAGGSRQVRARGWDASRCRRRWSAEAWCSPLWLPPAVSEWHVTTSCPQPSAIASSLLYIDWCAIVSCSARLIPLPLLLLLLTQRNCEWLLTVVHQHVFSSLCVCVCVCVRARAQLRPCTHSLALSLSHSLSLTIHHAIEKYGQWRHLVLPLCH